MKKSFFEDVDEAHESLEDYESKKEEHAKFQGSTIEARKDRNPLQDYTKRN